MVAALQSARLEGTAQYQLRTYTGPSVLVIDELGYRPFDQPSANWLFQVVSRRYQRGSIILTSNRSFSDWGQVFADPGAPTAIVDRLLHCATVLNFRKVAAAGRGRTKTHWRLRTAVSCGAVRSRAAETDLAGRKMAAE